MATNGTKKTNNILDDILIIKKSSKENKLIERVINMTPRRKCKLSDVDFRDIDLRDYSKTIKDTINKTVPGKNPRVFKEYFSTDELTHTEAVAIGRALAKIEDLKQYGKRVTIFRLFDGKTYESESSNKIYNKNKAKGGRMS